MPIPCVAPRSDPTDFGVCPKCRANAALKLAGCWYLRTKLASFGHEVFAALFLDSQHRLIEYVDDRLISLSRRF